MKEIKQTQRTKLKRLPKRGSFDREIVYKILDEAFICHIGFSVDGQTFVIPTAYGRKGDTLYVHGSAASRMMREMSKGIDVCVTVTLVDGLVLARSAFHHSINYRSVVIFGKAEIVESEAEKNDALFAFTEHLIPNRWAEIREPNSKELKGTTVLKLEITEASAKMRTGNPIDDAEDMNLDCWAGVIPLKLISEKPIDDDLLKKNIEMSDSVKNYRKQR
ncbi:MAG TPA: pyridoxamine 5'-phosphate oxidase family protein [Pyrinomonadaceae bacterium]|nr:pyridoxamine 5'-phosphate oxidase family protein [Pyrinomonadaceae bacterium]